MKFAPAETMSSDSSSPQFRSGMAAIVGRPNVGKSTLLNQLIGAKLSIVSHRAQTTRHRILGVYTDETSQIAFVDTPGFQLKHMSALNRSMNRMVSNTLGEVDVVMFVMEAGRFGPQEKDLLAMLPQSTPVVAVINKIDTSVAAR